MPRSIVLPERPSIQFGVWNRQGRLVSAPNLEAPEFYGPFRIGYKSYPGYALGASTVYQSRAEAADHDAVNITRWQAMCLREKRNQLTLTDVLVDRFIQSVCRTSYDWCFTFADGTQVRVEPTRGWDAGSMEGPTEGPFLVKRILATQRTFRLDNGESLVFSRKMRLRVDTVPQWIIDQAFSD